MFLAVRRGLASVLTLCHAAAYCPTPVEATTACAPILAPSCAQDSSLVDPVKSLADTLWLFVRWMVPFAVAGVLAAVAIGSNRIGEQVRIRVEARLAQEFPAFVVQVQGASLVEGEGIIVRGVSLIDPGMPQQWRQILWIDEIRLACNTNLAQLATAAPHITSVRLCRPIVHAVLQTDGEWNVSKLFKKRVAAAIIPLSVEDATVLVDDTTQRTRTTMRQIGIDVQPTAGDPAGTAWALVRGSITGDLFERASFQGRISPTAGTFELSGGVESLDLSPRLIAMLPAAATVGNHDGQLNWLGGMRGHIDLEWQTNGTLLALEQAMFSVSGRLESGRFEHKSLPFAMGDVSTAFKADRSGLQFESLEAHAGSTLLRGSGRLEGWSRESDFELLVEAERLIVGRHWEGFLPQAFADQWRKLLPAGEVDLRAHVVRRNGLLDPKVSLRCRNVSLTHYRFPYRLDRTVGTVVLNGRALSIHLTGQAGSHPVHVEGTLQTEPKGTIGFVEVRGDNMRIDDSLLAAMPAHSADIVRTLHAAGTFDFVFRHERALDLPAGHANSLGIQLTQCSLSYAGFPYPLSNVSGTIRMDRGLLSIKDVSGSNDTGIVRCTGSLVPKGVDDGELVLHLVGSGVVLERELCNALPRGMRRIWDGLDPRGNAEFLATIRHQVKNRLTDVELEATPQSDTVSIEPAWFPYRLERLGGRLVWKNGLLRFEGIHGVHARTTVSTEGTCRFSADGGWHVSFERLSADRFRADHDVIRALPEGLQRAINPLRPRGLLSLAGSLDIYSTAAVRSIVEKGSAEVTPGPPAAAWDIQLDMEQGAMDVGLALEHVHGGIRLQGQSDGRSWLASGELSLDSAMWHGIQVTAVHGPLAMDATGVRFGMTAVAKDDQGRPRRLAARLANGTLLVDGSVTSGDSGAFAVAASLDNADLERMACDAVEPVASSPHAHAYRGKVFGALEVSGSRSGTHSLVGRGQVRLREADIYELPVVVSLLKMLRIKAPDRNAFGSSLVDFRIEGPHAYLDNIELSGDAISLVGNGEVDFDSNLHMTFRSIMGDSETQLPVMKRVLGGASGQFMLIHVDGTISNPEMNSEVFPTLSAAIQKLQSQRRNPESPQTAVLRKESQHESRR